MQKLMLLTAVLSLGMTFGSVTFAGELDNENSVIEQAKANYAKELPAAVVVKVSEKDGSVSVLHSQLEIKSNDVLSFAKEHSGEFKAVSEKQKRGELDSDSSTSSWFFYFGGWGLGSYYYYPTYYYNSYYYSYNYYNYCYTGGYYYYYYGNPYYRYW